LEEQISTIIWVTPRLQSDVQELKIISDQFYLKYGREFGVACQSNSLSNVNEKVMEKLSIKAPPKRLVEQYLVYFNKFYAFLI